MVVQIGSTGCSFWLRATLSVFIVMLPLPLVDIGASYKPNDSTVEPNFP
jgi:hypothetical protein